MQQLAHKNTEQRSSFSLSLSKLEASPKIVEMTFRFNQKLKVRQQISHSGCAQQIQDKFAQQNIKKDDVCQSKEQEISCHNCAKWKNWASQQQKMLLQLEKQLIIKEEKLQEVLKSYKTQILQKSLKSQDLQLALQEKINQVSTLEKSLAAAAQQLEQIESQQKVLDTPKKQLIKQINFDILLDENKVQPIAIKAMQNTDKINNPTKDSAFTTRAEGWQLSQTMKKKHVEKVLQFGTRSQLQKYVFQNQTLKDYNTVLVERLKASKYKGVVY